MKELWPAELQQVKLTIYTHDHTQLHAQSGQDLDFVGPKANLFKGAPDI